MFKMSVLRMLIIGFCLLLLASQKSTGKDLFSIIENGKVGFIDREGNVIIPPQFFQAGSFHEGLAAVQLIEDGLMGFIDTTGKMVIEPAFIPVYYDLTLFSDSLALVVLPNSNFFAYINHSGKMAIPDSFASATTFSDGLALARRDTADWRHGYIDKTGKWVIQPQFYDASYFENGFAVVYVDTFSSEKVIIDHTGKVVFGPTKFQIWGPSEGVFILDIDTAQESQLQYFDMTGKPLSLPPVRTQVGSGRFFIFSEGFGALPKYDSSSGWHFGFMNRQGDTIVPPVYYEVSPFSEGLAMVTIYEGEEFSFAYIDTHGTMVIPPKIDGLDNVTPGAFHNGLAWIMLQGDDGSHFFAYIDKTGKVIWKAPVQ